MSAAGHVPTGHVQANGGAQAHPAHVRPDQRPRIDPRQLRPHPFSLAMFPPRPEDDDDALRADIEAQGVLRTLTVTGPTCASGPWMVLGGNRRRRLAEEVGVDVSYEIRDGLSLAEEEALILAENLGDQLGRRLNEWQRADLERELALRLAGRAGRPKNPVSVDGISEDRPQGDTRELVAKQAGTTASAYGERQAIFHQDIPVVPDGVKHFVTANPKKRNRIATIVRQVSQQPKVRAAMDRAAEQGLTVDQTADLPELRTAREQVAAAAGLVERKTKSATTTVVEVGLMATQTPTQVVFDAGTYGVEVVDGTRARFTRTGPKPKDDGVFIWPAEPWTVAITSWNWPHVVRHVVGEFPEQDRNRVLVGDVERFESRACCVCRSPWEWRNARCADCYSNEPAGPARSREHVVRRLTVSVNVAGGCALLELSIEEFASGIEAGLSSRADIAELRRPVLILDDAGFLPLDNGPFATIIALRARLEEALASLLAAHEGDEHA